MKAKSWIVLEEGIYMRKVVFVVLITMLVLFQSISVHRAESADNAPASLETYDALPDDTPGKADYEKGMDMIRGMFDGEDIDQAEMYNNFHSALKNGIERARYRVGECRLFGYGTALDTNLGKETITEASENGDERATEMIEKLNTAKDIGDYSEAMEENQVRFDKEHDGAWVTVLGKVEKVGKTMSGEYNLSIESLDEDKIFAKCSATFDKSWLGWLASLNSGDEILIIGKYQAEKTVNYTNMRLAECEIVGVVKRD
jgi:hypothetical protein